jgi:hypothetical protein
VRLGKLDWADAAEMQSTGCRLSSSPARALPRTLNASSGASLARAAPAQRTADPPRGYPLGMRIFAERLGPKGKRLETAERPDIPPHRVRQTILALVGELYDKAPEMTGEIRVRLVEEQ